MKVFYLAYRNCLQLCIILHQNMNIQMGAGKTSLLLFLPCKHFCQVFGNSQSSFHKLLKVKNECSFYRWILNLFILKLYLWSQNLPFLQTLSPEQNSPSAQPSLHAFLLGLVQVFSAVVEDSVQTVLGLLLEQSELEIQVAKIQTIQIK